MPEALTADQVRAIVREKLSRNEAYHSSQLSKDRARALRYYRGEPRGDEQEGHSQVVSRDIAEVVDSMLPGLLRVFTAGPRAVAYEPVGEEDREGAAQATQYANHIWYVDNPGFMNFYNWFKDGLLARVGVLKIWWDTAKVTTRREYDGLTALEVDALLAREGVEPVSIDARDPERPGGEKLHKVVVRETLFDGGIKIRVLPPDEFIMDTAAASHGDATFTAHQYRRTRSYLKSAGYDPELVDRIGQVTAEAALATNSEAMERLRPEHVGSRVDETIIDKAQEEVRVTECFLRIDEDGDGYAEMRKVTVAGDNGEVTLEDVEVDEDDFALLCPYPIPHKTYGESVADKLFDLQDIKTTLTRESLNNLYLINWPQREVVDDMVNVDDLLSPQINGLIRVKKLNSTREISVSPTYKFALEGITYMDTVRENRTGITKYNQGLDANTLNKTATGIEAIMGAANMRQELIARVYAETGVKDAFRKILKLIVRHQQKARIVRLRGKFVSMDPSKFNPQMDVTVSVGLGTGTKAQQLATINDVLLTQQEIVKQQGGPDGPLVKIEHIYNALAKKIELSDLQSPDLYFADPKEAEMPPPAPQEDPEVVKARKQAEIKDAEAAQDREIALAKAAQDMGIRQQAADQDLENKRRQAEAERQIAAERALFDAGVSAFQADHQAGLQAADAERKGAMAEREQEAGLRRKARGADAEAQLDRILNPTAEDEGEDMDAQVLQQMAAIAEGVKTQQDQTNQVLTKLAEGLGSLAQGMQALAEKVGRPRRVLRGVNPETGEMEIQGVE